MSESQDVLPFSRERQQAILGHLIYNENFFNQSKDKIRPEWFNDAWHSKIWLGKLNFFKDYDRSPSEEELHACADFRLENQGNQNKIRATIGAAKALTEHYKLDALVAELTPWLHARYFHEGLNQSQTLFNAGQFNEAYSRMEEKIRLIRSTTFEERPATSFDHPEVFFDQDKLELQNSLTFGVEVMDRLLLPAAFEKGLSGGGLRLGDSTVLLAPTNVGKTTAMITVAAANIMRKRHVLLLAHEGTERDLVTKVWMSLLDCNYAQLMNGYRSTTETTLMFGCQVPFKKAMDFFLGRIRKYLTFIHLPRPGLTVEEVGSVIRRLDEQHRIEHSGQGFDLVIDDYPSKLVSDGLRIGQFQRRDLDAYVYNYFVQLALELNHHSLTAIQANRTGSKINRGHKGMEERLLVPEDVNEAYGPMQTATNVITINRPPWYEQNQYVIYYIGKTRSNEKGLAVLCKSNYKNAVTHSDRLGATYYRGDVPLSQSIDKYFNSWKGKEIPFLELREAFETLKGGVKAGASA